MRVRAARNGGRINRSEGGRSGESLLPRAVAEKASLPGALEIPLVAKDQRPLREFAGVVLGREHFVVVRSQQHFGSHSAEFCANDRLVDRPEAAADPSSDLPQRKARFAGNATNTMMMQV